MKMVIKSNLSKNVEQKTIAARVDLVACMAGSFLVCFSFVVCLVKRFSHVKAERRSKKEKMPGKEGRIVLC